MGFTSHKSQTCQRLPFGGARGSQGHGLRRLMGAAQGMAQGGALVLTLALTGCGEAPAVDKTPLTLPPADGRAQIVRTKAGRFVVNRRQTLDGLAVRVTRLNGPDMDYSQGKLAKDAVQAYCQGFNREADPTVMGRFSVPNAWLFAGDCL